MREGALEAALQRSLWVFAMREWTADSWWTERADEKQCPWDGYRWLNTTARFVLRCCRIQTFVWDVEPVRRLPRLCKLGVLTNQTAGESSRTLIAWTAWGSLGRMFQSSIGSTASTRPEPVPVEILTWL